MYNSIFKFFYIFDYVREWKPNYRDIGCKSSSPFYLYSLGVILFLAIFFDPPDESIGVRKRIWLQQAGVRLELASPPESCEA